MFTFKIVCYMKMFIFKLYYEVFELSRTLLLLCLKIKVNYWHFCQSFLTCNCNTMHLNIKYIYILYIYVFCNMYVMYCEMCFICHWIILYGTVYKTFQMSLLSYTECLDVTMGIILFMSKLFKVSIKNDVHDVKMLYYRNHSLIKLK